MHLLFFYYLKLIEEEQHHFDKLNPNSIPADQVLLIECSSVKLVVCHYYGALHTQFFCLLVLYGFHECQKINLK